MTGPRVLLLALCLGLVPAAGTADGAPPEPEGYRTEAYRAPVPETVSGARVVDTEAALRLHADGAAFIDVMPRPERPADLPEGTLWIDKPRLSIPGARYAPNTGYGVLSPDGDAYLRHVLETVTAGDESATVVLFCRADCWMSWNAAKRAATEYGYTDVRWYPDGTDGWEAAGHALVPVEPMAAP